MVVNFTKISQKRKSKSLLSREKKYYKMRKNVIRIIRKYCNLENFASL